MFNKSFTLEAINELSEKCMVGHIGIVFTEIGDTFLKATMPVDHRTTQPFGLLHGGASVVLAETMGSMASTMLVNPNEQYCVGLEINANHIKSAKSGLVSGIAKAIHIGKRTHVWEIRVTNDEDDLVCISRLTIAVIDKK